MVDYEFLEEKRADVKKFAAYGQTLEEVLTNTATALLRVVTRPGKISPGLSRAVELKAESPRALLYDWLEELLKIMNMQSFVPSSVRVQRVMKRNGGWLLKARLKGEVTHDRMFLFPRTILHEDTFLEERGDGWAVQVAVRV